VLARHVAHFRQREEEVAIAGGHRLLVKLADRFVRLPGRQAVEVVAVQSRNGARTGFAGAQGIFLHLGVSLPGGHAVGPNRGPAAGKQQDQ